MERNCKGCIWGDQCMSKSICDDFTPFDDGEENEKYYIQNLEERHRDYAEIVNEYSDGRWDI